MSHSAHRSQKRMDSAVLPRLRRQLSNLFFAAGLSPASARTHGHRAPEMSTSPSHHRTFFLVPRDYVHRRRFRRRLTNLILIPALSVLVAYVITRPTGGQGFTLPKAVQQASHSVPSNHESEVLAAARVSGDSGAASALGSPEEASSAGTPASPMLGGSYMLDRGPYAVTEVPDMVLHEAERNRDLHLRVFYPNGPGPYPVILFSPDEGHAGFCCEALTRHWATYGYVTLEPSHGGPAARGISGGKEESSSAKTLREGLNEPARWQSRVRDVSFVLDSLPELQKRIPTLADKIDAEHIGVGGESLGAFTAGVVGGALIDLPGQPAESFSDPRVKAIFLLSPQGPGQFGLTSHSWDYVKLPMLSVTESLDRGEEKQKPEWREIPFDRSQRADKFQVFIRGGEKTSFVSAKSFSQERAASGMSILGYTNSAALAFWDAYLKSDPKAKMYLQSSALPDFSQGAVRITRR